MISLRAFLLLGGALAAMIASMLVWGEGALAGVTALLVLITLLICWSAYRAGTAKGGGVAGVATFAAVGHGTSVGEAQSWSRSTVFISAILLLASVMGCITLLQRLAEIELLRPEGGDPGAGFYALVIAVWACGWLLVEWLADVRTINRWFQHLLAIIIPLIFGAGLLMLWEVFTRALDVPQVLLPSPSEIAARFAASTTTLWADFKQTFLKAVLIGYSIGCVTGFVIAILIDRSPFLQRGLLPVGNLISALPIIGIAPIMVMWFGFDWPSKAAVVVIMTFFPMLVNTISGLAASNHMQQDLMKTYAAGYWQSLFKLRLPQAMPFIFNALKINSTLALIGAIVAEFFGTPIVGMGFRISTEVGRMNVDMVWAEIAVAAIAGSCFYGVLTLIERFITFWHPSMRSS